MKKWDPQANDIFASALEIESDEARCIFIDRECASDQMLCRRVYEMLSLHKEAGSFLAQPVVELESNPTASSFETIKPKETEPHFPTSQKPMHPKAILHWEKDLEGERIFGDYILLEEIDRGGMGVVFKARQQSLGRTVAVKMILAGVLASDDEVSRFHREAEVIAGLQHPGIVPIFDVGEIAGQHYFSMLFIDGGNLLDKLGEGPMERCEAAAITKKISEAIAHAHSQGVIHRDLKPRNVLLDSKKQPKIIDFGLSQRLERNDGITKTGQILGTPSFMSPEQAKGQEIHASADIYAIGAILYNLLTGRPPFEGASSIETLKLVVDQEPVALRLLNPQVDRDLETVCLKCLEKDPSRRFATADEIACELDRYLSGKPVRSRPVGLATRLLKWCKRNPSDTILGGIAVSILLIGILSTLAFAFSSQTNFRKSETQRLRADANARHAVRREEETRALLLENQERSKVHRRHLYNAQMNVCGISIQSNGGTELIQSNLRNWIPTSKKADSSRVDLRGWEWRFFNSFVHRFSQSIELDGQGFAMNWNPTGEFLAVGVHNAIVIFDKQGNEVVVLDEHPHLVRSLRWAKDGKQLASGSHDGTLIVWEDPLQTTNHRKLPCIAKPILSLDWNRSGNVLAVLFEYNNQVELWEPSKNRQLAILDGSGTQLCFSPNTDRLACGFEEDIRIWDVSDLTKPKISFTFSGGRPLAKSVAWDPSGRIVAAGYFNGAIKYWDLKTKKETTLLGHSDCVFHLDWNTKTGRLLSSSFDYSLREWDVTKGQEIENLHGHTDRVFAAEYNPSGEKIASTGEDQTLRFWDPDSPAIRVYPDPDAAEIPGLLDRWKIDWHPERDLISTSQNTRSTVRDLTSQNQVKIEGSHFCWMFGKDLAATSVDDRVIFWNTEASQIERQIPLLKHGESHRIIVRDMTWSPQTKNLAIICRKYLLDHQFSIVYVCDVEEATDLEAIAEFDKGAICASWSPDGTKMAVGCTYGFVQIWDEKEMKTKEFELPIEGEAVLSVSWNQSGTKIAFGCADHTIRIWNVADGSVETLRGHTFPVWSVAWHPDENRLASTSSDQTVRIWDTIHGERVTTFSIDEQGRSVRWRNDGKQLAAIASDGTLTTWNPTR